MFIGIEVLYIFGAYYLNENVCECKDMQLM